MTFETPLTSGLEDAPEKGDYVQITSLAGQGR
jgi:hypothetical protein